MLNSWAPRFVTLVALSVFFTPDVAFGRIRWLERDGRQVLYPRRFDQQNPIELSELGNACPGQVCGTLAGSFVSTLLADAPECSQQDACDDIVDASKQFDAATQANMISLAQKLRKREKNTPPDFTTQPPINRNSVFCQKCPRNPELNGLVQAQDPANNRTAFFDPASGKTVILGTQANTKPFPGPCTNNPATANTTATTNTTADTNTSAATNKTATTDNKDAATKKTANVCKANNNSSTSSPSHTSSTPDNSTSLLSSNSSGANFGSCSTPQIKFAQGLDGRRETAFEPTNQKSYNHGSAQNINIITQFMCDALTNTCKANQAAKDLCTQAENAANAATPAKTGKQADVFNKFFGFETDFEAVTALNDQGQPLSGTSGSGSTPANGTALATSTTSGASFGSCSTPQIKFAEGLDGRKETAFAPVDLASYNHGSADNINVITQFMCNALTNTCKANQAAKDLLCTQGEAAATAATPPLSGAQADAFNKIFGLDTNFKTVTPIDNTGKPVTTQ